MIRRLWPAASVLVVMIVVVTGGYVVAASLAIPAGPPVTIGDAVMVTPLSGWQFAGQGRSGDMAAGGFTRGSANLDVFSLPTSDDPQALLARYVDSQLGPASRSLSVSQHVEQVTAASGLPAVRVSYVGTFGARGASIEGEITSVVSPTGIGAVFDAWGPEGQFGYARGDTRVMVRTAVLR